MSESEFIAYVGDADIHDGRISSTCPDGDDLLVEVTAANGRTIQIRFNNVHRVQSDGVEGMLLYALAEMKTTSTWRRFVFANWDDDDSAQFEIFAEDVQIDDRP